MSELFRMKDTVEVTDIDGTGRQVVLLPGLANAVSPVSQASEEQEVGDNRGPSQHSPLSQILIQQHWLANLYATFQ